jgi:DNA-binding transcriptional LysR family regulator
MDQLDTMRVFVAVAEARGFAAGARRVGRSAPVVTRAVAGLERRLGTRLLQRTTRVVRLTEAGTRYLADCRRILAEVASAEESLRAPDGKPRGALHVAASRIFGRMFVTPLVLDFLEAHREVTVHTLLDDQVVDLIEAGIDVAVRIGALPDSSFTATRVGSVRRVLCASPGYLERHGMPRKPADLEALDALVFSGASARSEWTLGSGRAARTVRPRSMLSTNDADVIIAAAIAGHGVARVLSYQVSDAVADGRLTRLLTAFEPPPIPVSVVCPAGRGSSPKVRAFFDFAVARLRAATWLS